MTTKTTSSLTNRQSRMIRRRINAIISIILAIAAVFAIVGGIYTIASNSEMYDTVARKSFKNDLNNGDEEAIERYKNEYIENDKYLFNGPLTIKLMAEKYDLDSNELYEIYVDSDYDTAQDFYKHYVKDLVK